MKYEQQADFDAASGADEEERERRGIGSPQERWGCACPRIDSVNCIKARSAPDWDTAGDWTEPDERCECHCHDLDDDDGDST